jgi:hypothetical protein
MGTPNDSEVKYFKVLNRIVVDEQPKILRCIDGYAIYDFTYIAQTNHEMGIWDIVSDLGL